MAPEPVIEVNGQKEEAEKETEPRETEREKKDEQSAESDGEIDVDADSSDVAKEEKPKDQLSHRTFIKASNCVCV